MPNKYWTFTIVVVALALAGLIMINNAHSAPCALGNVVVHGATLAARSHNGHPLITIEGVGISTHGSSFTTVVECNATEAHRLRVEVEGLLAEDSFTPETIPEWLLGD